MLMNRPGKILKASTVQDLPKPYLKEPTVNFHAKFPLTLYLKLSEISDRNEIGRNELVKRALKKFLYE